jgi:hypothetical protein
MSPEANMAGDADRPEPISGKLLKNYLRCRSCVKNGLLAQTASAKPPVS